MKSPWTVILSIVLTAVVVGGGLYLIFDQKIKSEKERVAEILSDAQEQQSEALNNAQQEAANQAANQSAGNTQSTQATIYQDTFADFNFELPAGYAVVKQTNSEGLTVEQLTIVRKEADGSNTSTGVIIKITDWQSNQTLADWNDETSFTFNKVLGQLNVGGVAAVKYDISGLVESAEYRFVKGKFTFSITVSGNYAGQEQLVKTILESFEFQN